MQLPSLSKARTYAWAGLLASSSVAPLMYAGQLSFTTPLFTVLMWGITIAALALLLIRAITRVTHLLLTLILLVFTAPISVILILLLGWVMGDELAQPLHREQMDNGIVCEVTPFGNVVTGGNLTSLYSPVPHLPFLRKKLGSQSRIDGSDAPPVTCESVLALYAHKTEE